MDDPKRQKMYDICATVVAFMVLALLAAAASFVRYLRTEAPAETTDSAGTEDASPVPVPSWSDALKQLPKEPDFYVMLCLLLAMCVAFAFDAAFTDVYSDEAEDNEPEPVQRLRRDRSALQASGVCILFLLIAYGYAGGKRWEKLSACGSSTLGAILLAVAVVWLLAVISASVTMTDVVLSKCTQQ